MRSDYLTKKRQKELTWLALFIYAVQRLLQDMEMFGRQVYSLHQQYCFN